VGVGSRVRVKGGAKPPEMSGLIGKVTAISVSSKTIVLEIEQKSSQGAKKSGKLNRVGLKWKDAGSSMPATGREIHNPMLMQALQQNRLNFSKTEFEQFAMPDLLEDSFIKVDEKYFKPAASEITLEMQHVKIYKHGHVFQRDQLETLIAEAVFERHLAGHQLQRFCRRFYGRTKLLSEKQEEFQKEDIAARFSQAMIRRWQQGKEGQKELKRLRHERNLQELGADLQCLDLLKIARDGDTIVVPKGRHYARVTELADSMSAWQTYMQVVDSSEVRERFFWL